MGWRRQKLDAPCRQEVRAVDGTVYRLELSDEPEPDSIMVVQPDPADNSPYSQLGHVAWVFQYIEDEEGWGLVGVLESTVYPPPDWGTAEINGCVYRKIYYFWRPGSNTKKFLVFRERGDLAT